MKPNYDRLVAAELRAEAGRQRLAATTIAARAGLSVVVVRRRLRGDVHIHFDQLDELARAMGTTGRAIQARALDVLDGPRPTARERIS